MESQSLGNHTLFQPAKYRPQNHNYIEGGYRLNEKLQQRFTQDILSVYEQSLFANLELTTSEGKILSHISIISSQSNSLWILLEKIAATQGKTNTDLTELLSITLQEVDYYILESFIRSLYTNTIELYSLEILDKQLRQNLPSSSTRKKSTLIIEPLNRSEEKHINLLITEQLKTGHISRTKGNLKDITHLFSLPSQSPVQDTRSSTKPFVEKRNYSGAFGLESDVCSFCGNLPSRKSLKMSLVPSSVNSSAAPISNGTSELDYIDDRCSSINLKNTKETTEQESTDDCAADVRDNSITGDNSSLEVEMASSQESFSLASTPVEARQELISESEQDEQIQTGPNPLRPLTRTRTFEVINPSCNTSTHELHDSFEEINKNIDNVPCHNASYEPMDAAELRELERKKGSLIFENNFQTFSNIPSTNMMSVSMGSASSMGMGSIHGSMMSSLQSSDMSSPAGRVYMTAASLTQSMTPIVNAPESLQTLMSSSTKEELNCEEKEKDENETTVQSLATNARWSKPVKELPLDEERSRKLQRLSSCSSVRDVDAIPVVTGYVSLDQGRAIESRRKSSEADSGSESNDGKSMFPMFIDLDQIPSPVKEELPKREPVKSQSSAVYMFIEADTHSPKVKRKASMIKDIHAKVTSSEASPRDMSPKSREVFQKTPTSARKVLKKSMQPESTLTEASPNSMKHSLSQNRKTKETVMSKSAPTDSLLFGCGDTGSKTSTPDHISLKMMTKSVIDRDEFMSQPPARRNVSVNDKINEASKIPRPVANFRTKLNVTKDSSSNISQASEKAKPNAKLLSALDIPQRPLTDTSLLEDFTDLPFDPEAPSSPSDASSLLRSLGKLPEYTTDAGKLNQDTLADGLLKMLLNEINTDVIIQVADKKIRAHKCILSSRCVYFAAMFSANWNGNVITLQGFSYETVMIALKHIYTGVAIIPATATIEDLAAISDLLVLDGLKEYVAYHLQTTRCHSFHKPCHDCKIGVFESLPLAAAFCMDEFFRKSLAWIAKHCVKLFPTKGFAKLPSELQARCAKQIVNDMSVNNVLNTAQDCDAILNRIQGVRGADCIAETINDLFDSVIQFITIHISSVLASHTFVSIGCNEDWSAQRIEETFSLCIRSIKPDEAVLSHIQIEYLLQRSREPFTVDFVAVLESLQKKIEKFLILNANRVCVSRKWPLLPKSDQKRIKEASMAVFESAKMSVVKPKFASVSRFRNLEPTTRARASSMSDQRLNKSSSSSVLPQSKTTSRKLKPTADRCQTPPAPSLKQTLQTPLANRTSMLRAQAAIQRSQSARSVSERPRRTVKHNTYDGLTEDDSSEANSNLSRGGTFTKSVTKSEQTTNRSRTPIRHNKKNSRQSQLPIATCKSESNVRLMLGHKRNFSGPQLGAHQKQISTDSEGTARTYSLGNKGLRQHAGLPSVSCIPKLATHSMQRTAAVNDPVAREQGVRNGRSPLSTISSNKLSLLTRTDSQDDEEGTLWSLHDHVSTPPPLSRSNTFSKDS